MRNLFEQAEGSRIPRSKFDLSHERKLTLNMGGLYPVMTQEVVPGDAFRVGSEIFIRAFALIAPVMHRVNVRIEHFFVPNRLVHTNWPDFITGGPQGTDVPVLPYFTMDQVNAISPNLLKVGGLIDHFGLPTLKSTETFQLGYSTVKVSALPFRAYQLIYNEYYRDQNLEAPLLNPTGDGAVLGANLTELLTFRNRCWEKDYSTSSLPWAQRGGAVSIPNVTSYKKPSLVRNASTDALMPAGVDSLGVDSSGNFAYGGTLIPIYLDNVVSTAFTVNALRVSIRLQEWLERSARGGARYIEAIKAHFNVQSSDARLQRPEYLGGSKAPVVISEVLSTSTGTAAGQTPLATLGGHGMSAGSGGYERFFEEHGFVISLLSILPATSYQQAMPKWATQRVINTDFLWPEFATLGEQAVLNQEIYFSPGDNAVYPYVNNTFGYQSRYAEYKYQPSLVSGQFKETLAFWHMGRIFPAGVQPALNAAYVISNPRVDAFAVTTDVDHWACHIFHQFDAMRPLPYFGTPDLS